MKLIVYELILRYFCNRTINKEYMRRNFITTLALSLCITTIVSCDGKKPRTVSVSQVHDDDIAVNVTAPMTVKEVKYEKDTKYAKIEVDVEYPDGDDNVSANIRKDLMAVLSEAAKMNEYMSPIVAYKSEAPDMADAVDYYGKKLLAAVSTQSKEDNKTRNETEVEFAKEEGREPATVDVMQYYYDIEIEREWETNDYCVYDAEVEMFSGGAHGSSIDLGGLTYDKHTGKRFANFLKPSTVMAMQKLLRAGLVSYFVKQGETMDDAGLNDMLQIEGTNIPLPKLPPYPTKKGMKFVYGQYEIAPYAAGKPKFIVPYNQIKQYLTPEAIQLLGL